MIPVMGLSPAAKTPPPTRLILSRDPRHDHASTLTTVERCSLARAVANGTLLSTRPGDPRGPVARLDVRAYCDPHTGGMRYALEAWADPQGQHLYQLSDYDDVAMIADRCTEYLAAQETP